MAALVAFAWGVWRIGLSLYRDRWTAVALLAAMTLRHAIARSGTNTLEGYLQPRLIAYALGALAIAAFLRGRLLATAAVLILAFALHPTTALWFAVWLAVAAAIARPGLRKGLGLVALAAAAGAVWAVTAGPLAGRLTVMDPEWQRLLAPKDYLFPLEWPFYAWALNLGYLAAIVWLYRLRARAGQVEPAERALTLGSFSLAAVFAVALVLQAAKITLAFQLQPARVFWMFDFLAIIYAVWAVCEGNLFAPRASGVKTDKGLAAVTGRRRALVATLIILCLSAARGVYVLAEARRPLLQVSIPDDDWGRVMAWARTTDKKAGWLADPMHAVLYGTSVRVAGERDVLVEAVKDAAIGMYDRQVAIRTNERLEAVPDFSRLAPADARALAAVYDLDFLVTEQALELPLAFESGNLRVYRLK